VTGEGPSEGYLAPSAQALSDPHFRTIADNAPVLIWVAGLDKGRIFFNRPWLEFTGRKPEQELGRGWTEGVHPDDLERCLETFDSHFDRSQPLQMEYRLRRHDGEYRWMIDNSSPIFSEEGAFQGFIGSAVDITGFKHAEDELLRNREEMAAGLQQAERDRREAESLAFHLARLHAARAALAPLLTTPEIATVVVREAAAALNARAGSISLIDASHTTFRLHGMQGYSEEINDRWTEFPRDSDNPISRCFDTLKPMLWRSADEFLRDFPHLEVHRQEGLEAYACVPIAASRRNRGVLALSFSEVRNLNEEERDLMVAFGHQAAQALDRADLFEQERASREQAERTASALIRLRAATDALAGSFESPKLYAEMLEQAAMLAGANTGSLFISRMTDSAIGDKLDVVATLGIDGEWDEREVTTLDVDLPGPASFRTQRIVVCDREDEIEAAFPNIIQICRNLGVKSFAAIPVRANGRMLGALVLGAGDEEVFKPEIQEVLQAFSDHCGLAIERARLYESERSVRARLDAVIAGVPGVVWEAWGSPDAASQKIDFVSHYVEQMLGYSTEEWLSKPNFWLTIVHPEDQERAARESTAIFESGQGGINEFRWVAKDGSVYWVQASTTIIKDEAGNPVGMRGVTVDVSSRKYAEIGLDLLSQAGLVLNESLDYEDTLIQLNRVIVPDMADWSVLHLIEGEEIKQISLAHRDTEKLRWVSELQARYPPSNEDLGQGPIHVIKTGQPELVPDLPPELLEKSAQDEEHLRLILELGLRSYICVPIKGREGVLGALTLITSESGRRYDEAALALVEEIGRRAGIAIDNARLYRDSQLARAQLEQSNRAKDEFLGIVSHELRTPLTTIFGSARLLAVRGEAIGKEARDELMQGISEESEKMTALVEDLLLLARLDMGRAIEKSLVNVEEAVGAVVEEVSSRAMRKAIELRNYAGDVAIQAEPTFLRQIVLNFLTNAMKYAEPDQRIEVEIRQNQDEVLIAVLDRGPGVEEEELALLFDSFYRSKRTSHLPCKGLGLAVCQRLAEAQGGRVWAKLRPGGGLEVGVSLPRDGV
jgi:PAS domain S-box-containing protein